MNRLKILLLILLTLLVPGCVAGAGDAEVGSFYAFTKANPSTWSFGDVLTSGQQNLVDDNAAKCTDTFPVPMVFEDDASFQGGIAAFGPITVDQDVTVFFGGPVTCDQTLAVNGNFSWNGSGTFTINDAGSSAVVIDPFTTFQNITNFNETAIFGVGATGYSFEANGKVDLNGITRLLGTNTQIGNSGGTDVLTVYSATSFNAPIILTDRLTTSGNGRVIDRAMLGTDSTLVIPVGVKRVFYPTGVLTANHSAELPPATQEGDVVEVVNDDPTYVVNVLLPGGGGFFNLAYSAAPSPPTPYRAVTAVVVGGSWRVFNREAWNSP